MIKILLTKTNDGWMSAQYVNGNPDSHLIKYFGTHILPTAFTANASVDVVIAEIKRLNPTAEVVAV